MQFRLHILVFFAALLTIGGRFWTPDFRWLLYLSKPLTTLLILLLSMVPAATACRRYQRWVALGLFSSLIGDIFLMLPQNFFIPGLFSFLLTHICYLSAFTTDCPFMQRKSPLVLLLPAMLLLLTIWSGVAASLRIPVILYFILITAMTLQAISRALAIKNKNSWLAAAGACLFFCSDALLSIDHFQASLTLASVWILGTYYPAQWLIASSVHALKTPRVHRRDEGSEESQSTGSKCRVLEPIVFQTKKAKFGGISCHRPGYPDPPNEADDENG